MLPLGQQPQLEEYREAEMATGEAVGHESDRTVATVVSNFRECV